MMCRYLYKVVILIPLDIYPRNGSAGHMAALFFISEQTFMSPFTSETAPILQL